MPLRKRKPTSPGRRFQTVSDFSEITRTSPRSRCSPKKPGTGGRNSYGRKTARHRGGGHKQQYRVIDFRRNKDGVPAKVAAIEYDPNRNCRIALLHYLDGEKRYILAPQGRARSATCCRTARARRSAPATPCRCATSRSARRCTTSSCKPGGGGKMARCAGHRACSCVAKEGDFATLRLPSTEMRRVPDRLPGHRRRGRQRRARAHQDRQGRPQPLEGRAPADPRRRHEPRRPPARWWRGQDLRWPPSGVAVGQARGPHPRQEQAVPEAHRPPPPHPRLAGGRPHAPQPEEGPVRRRPPAQEGRRPERQGREEGHQDLVAAAPRSSPTWWATPSPSTTVASTCPCTSPSRWSVTSSASSRRTRTFRFHAGRRRACEGGAGREPWPAAPRRNERPGTSAPGRASSCACRRTRPARSSTSSAASTSTRPLEILEFTERASRRGHSQAARLGRGQRREQRRAGPRGRALRVGVLRRRGPDAQAVAATCPGPGDPDPQADAATSRSS